MGTISLSSVRRSVAAAGMTALVAVTPLLAATGAQALGNNRTV